MHITAKQILFWMPRILCILFALFLSVFALDVFNEGYGIGETILALFIHLTPTILIIVALVIAWRWEWVGTILFVFLSLLYLAMSRGKGWLVSGPLLFIAVLFLSSHLYRLRARMLC